MTCPALTCWPTVTQMLEQCVQSSQPAAVVQLDVVTVTAAPTVQPVGDGHCAVGSRKDRRALWHRDVGTAVVADFAGNRVGTVSLRGCDCARHRQRPLEASIRQQRIAARCHHLTATRGKTTQQFAP